MARVLNSSHFVAPSSDITGRLIRYLYNVSKARPLKIRTSGYNLTGAKTKASALHSLRYFEKTII